MCRGMKKLVMQEGITFIGEQAFSCIPISGAGDNYVLEEIVIPASVEAIGIKAFSNLKAVKTLTFTEGSQLISLGFQAFSGMTSLEGMTFPAGLKEFGTEAKLVTFSGKSIRVYSSELFSGNKAMKYLDMSACADMTAIPIELCKGLSGIETLLLPPNVETIGNQAFYNMTSLKDVTIPASVYSLGGYAFYGCKKLEKVTFESGSVMEKLGIEEAIPYSNNNTDMMKGLYVFANTPALKSVTLPTNLTVIGIGCFMNSGIEAIGMPASLAYIGDYAFKECKNLKAANFSAETYYIGDEAFYGCVSLENANMVEGLQHIGNSAFTHCEKMKSVYIPATLTSMAGNPFASCYGLETFTISEENVDFILVDGVLYDRTMYTLIYYPTSMTAETFEIPESVNEIAAGAFADSKLKSVEIPNQVTEILEGTFRGSALESVTFHRGINSIGDYAFEGCKNLNNVKIPNSARWLGNYIFANCTSLTNFEFEDQISAASPYILGTHFFDGCTSLSTLVLPNHAKISDEEAANYTGISNYKDRALPAYMFANTGLVNVVLPENITVLDAPGIFMNCKQLETFVFEAKQLNTYYLGEKLFYGCSKLKSLTFPVFASAQTVIQNNGYVFAECTALESVIFLGEGKDRAQTVGEGVFQNCVNLETVKFYKLDGTEHTFAGLRKNAFKGCAKLKSLKFGNNGISSMYEGALSGTAFEVLKVTNVRYFDEGPAFAGMAKLKQLFITNKELKMDARTFQNLACDVDIYFYEYTKEEVIKMAGTDEWFTKADAKAHFYFKDTMPADVVVPE
jgi:hypothetical protein